MKLVKSLHQKKYRDQTGLFLVEGVKLVGEAIQYGAKLEMIAYACELDEIDYALPAQAIRISKKDLSRISMLKNPNRILAVCRQYAEQSITETEDWMVALNRVSDPGNLGTILRICDWFGVSQVLCDRETVELYNPKVVQASMGSIFRVKVNYLELEEYLSECDRIKVLADMEGDSVYDSEFPPQGILIMGSESHGPDEFIRKSADKILTIPKAGGGESLNVAVSTGIILSHLRRFSST